MEDWGKSFWKEPNKFARMNPVWNDDTFQIINIERTLPTNDLREEKATL